MTEQEAKDYYNKYNGQKMTFDASSGKEEVEVIGYGKSMWHNWVVFTSTKSGRHVLKNYTQINGNLHTLWSSSKVHAFTDTIKLIPDNRPCIEDILPVVSSNRYLHKCLVCNSPAYRGFSSFECSNERCGK